MNSMLKARLAIADVPDAIVRSYDAHKSGGVTVSHLRFGPKPIRAPWLVDMAHYVGVHQQQYWAK